ncbi:DUF72 domain-containing protein [bacterium]|nr:DUF72 domain-containing protein [bacterium]
MSKLFIGTSGFSYLHWGKDVFYPKDLPRSSWFEYYFKYFNSVEINSSFYHLPSEKTFTSWYNKAPSGFIFAVKVSRIITHIKKIQNCTSPWKEFLNRALLLKEKLGPFLFQFPPNWKKDLKRLENFVELITNFDKSLRFAFEFRHSSWYSQDVYDFFLSRKNISFCIIDSPYWPKTKEVFGDFVYIRMHGRKSLYSSNYSQKELKTLAQEIKGYLNKGLDVYCYFNNDAQGFACNNARGLLKLCGK